MIVPPIPIHSSWVPTVLDRIADKKVLKVALGILELIVHYILGYTYYPYSSLYLRKRARVHHLGGLRVIDFTDKGTLGIVALCMKKGPESWITVAGKRVFFQERGDLLSKPDPNLKTGEIWVEDDEHCLRFSILPPLSSSTSSLPRIGWKINPSKVDPSMTGEQIYIARTE